MAGRFRAAGAEYRKRADGMRALRYFYAGQASVKIVDLAVEQGAGHDEALDLIGAFVDLGDLSPSRGRPSDLPGKQRVSSGNMSH
jgi:hypothetical protein